MATLKPLARPLLHIQRPHTHSHSHSHSRPFLTNLLPSAPKPSIQTLRAARTLPYPSAPIYSIIADVPSYASFLPYCTRSTITAWSAPDSSTGRRWPSAGELTSGFAGLSETFASRVYCVPGRVVESVGGDAETALPEHAIQHHLVGHGELVQGLRGKGKGKGKANEASEGLLAHLRNTWTVRETASGETQIELALEFSFHNPMYAALSAGAAPKVAEAMVRAFEERVASLLTENPDMVHARLEDLDGSRIKR